MAWNPTATVEPTDASWPPFGRPRVTRSTTEQLTTLAIIAACHAVAVLALWTRHLLIEQEPAPLLVNPIDTLVPQLPSPPPVVMPAMTVPPVALAPPMPPSIEDPEAAPTAITARELPAELPAPAPVASSVVTEARFDVDYLNNPKPTYPPLSRRLREEGVVVLKVLVRSDGTVANALIDKHSGSTRLDDAALSALKQWHFVPARRGNEAIESWVLVPIEFELEN